MARGKAAALDVPEVVERALGEGTFSVEKFVESFPVLVEATGSADALRGFVADLAVRGRLTAPRPDDEPALALLARVSGLRAKQGTVGRSLKSDLESSDGDESPFPVGTSWCWTKLGDLVVKLGAGSTPLGGKAVYRDAGVKFLRSQNIWNDGLRLEGVAFIDAKTHEKMSGTWVEPGDVLLNITGASIGRCSVVPSDFDIANVSQHVAIVRLADKDLTRFLHLCICSPYFQKTIMAVQVGVSREGLSMKRLQDFLVPLPPLAEQKRIVARVDQLMALIDQLEAKQNRKRDLGARFTKASLEALTTAESPQDFTTAWTRIHKTWPTLLDCAERIVQIRKAIVALALRGKLLPQAASEGTVEGLLQILARHGLAVRQAGIDGLPSLPDSWAWVHLGSLVTFGPKNGYSPKAVDRPTKVKSLTLSATTSGAFDGSFFKYIDEDVPDDSDLWLSDGDILVQRGNTIDYVGVAAVFRGPKRTFIYPDLMMKIRIDPELDLDFIHLALNGPSAREFIVSRASGTSGTMPKINQGVLLDIPIPLPPAPEQRRIAARVQSLMKLCDALEAALRRSEDRAAKLAEAVVQEMVAV